MTFEKRIAILDARIHKQQTALEEIRKRTMEHPAFYKDAFDDRDIDALVEHGGDICDWTMIAILADDALK